jgi:hypothetical protein
MPHSNPSLIRRRSSARRRASNVPRPAVLLGATHGVALLVRTRTVGATYWCALTMTVLFTLALTGGVSALGRQYGEHEPYMSTELFHEVTEKPRGALVEHLAVFGEDIRLILDVGLGGVHLW